MKTQINNATKILTTRLEWMVYHNQEDRRVDVGCKTCNERTNLMASTALTAWLPFHDGHEVWMKNPFQGKRK